MRCRHATGQYTIYKRKKKTKVRVTFWVCFNRNDNINKNTCATCSSFCKAVSEASRRCWRAATHTPPPVPPACDVAGRRRPRWGVGGTGGTGYPPPLFPAYFCSTDTQAYPSRSHKPYITWGILWMVWALQHSSVWTGHGQGYGQLIMMFRKVAWEYPWEIYFWNQRIYTGRMGLEEEEKEREGHVHEKYRRIKIST